MGRSRLQGNEAGELDPVRGIVGRFEKSEAARVAVLEPGMVGAIELDHLPQGSLPRSGHPVSLAPLLHLPASLGNEPGPQRRTL